MLTYADVCTQANSLLPAQSMKETLGGLLARESDVVLLQATLVGAKWPGSDQRIHPVWVLVARAIARGGLVAEGEGGGVSRSEGGGGGGGGEGRAAASGGAQKEKKEKDEIRAVLERMWTEVIVRLSPALELQVARRMLTYADVC